MRHPTIYADYQATTPTDPRVVEVMSPYWSESFGNPHSSDHAVGWQAAKIVSSSAQSVGELIGADPDEIIFTSGATEANNLALFGLAYGANDKRRKILVSAIEHKCVLENAQALATRNGFQVGVVPVDRDGNIRLNALLSMLDDSVLVVSIMAVNNEIGTVQDIDKISEMVRSYGALFHCDTAQAPCAMDMSMLAEHADLASLSAHKMYGPQGIGALYISRSIQNQIEPLILGGGQQQGLRSGTIPVALCAGMAEASRIIMSPEIERERTRIANQRNQLFSLLEKGSFPIIINGPSPIKKHPGNLNLQFSGFHASEILGTLQPNLAASTGSACTSGTPEPSHVLHAIGLDKTQNESSIRFSFGRFTTDAEIKQTAQLVNQALENLADAKLKKIA